MNNSTTNRVVLGGLLMAMVFIATVVTKIPMASGYFNLGDIFVMISGILLGRYFGFAVGGISSAMADIYSGCSIYAPITFIVKGLEAFVVAAIFSNKEKTAGRFKTIIGVICGSVIMVGGYFIAESFILNHIDKSLGLSMAIKDLPVNGIQGGLSSVISYLLITILNKANIINDKKL
ncbi:MAG: ECF transporter S component [Bacillota bacterium]|nr:ECF transporter S component [Bacillota bacterium]